jgi:hypothetical protein
MARRPSRIAANAAFGPDERGIFTWDYDMGDLASLEDGIEFAAVFDHLPGTHKTRGHHETVATAKFHRLPPLRS